ncbi:MAG: hypothetical protein KY469_15380 [Actinobacteria bacterium]|nr:hypothetical protein [Actinomycetota bacterium]
MSRRLAAMLAWVLAVAAVGAVALTIVIGSTLPTSARTTAGFTDWWQALWLLSWVGFPLVGGFVASRRPESRLAWLMLLVGTSIAVGVLGGTWLLHEVRVAGRTPPGLVIWLEAWIVVPGFALAPFVIDRFPSDRPAEGRWRWVVRTAAAAVAVLVGASMLRPTVVEGDLEPPLVLDNPLAAFGGLPETLITAAALTLVGFFVLVVGRLILRYRRAIGAERAQLKWFVAATAVFPLLFAVVLPTTGLVPGAVTDGLVALAFFLTLNGIAVAIGIAVTRYRLYDIDRVISRTLAYALLTGVLVGVYALGVLGVGALLPGEPSDLLVAGSTLVVAALFRPLQSRIQALVDRRFNRSRYDAARTIEAFGARLRDEVDLDEVAADLGRATSAALQPRSVAVWLATAEVSS